MNWKLVAAETVLRTIPFNVEKLDIEDSERGKLHPFHRLSAPDWANILPITKDGKAILINQPRAGSMQMILESPGGAVDPNEKEALGAAARELEEETGYISGEIKHVISINPNPALFYNQIHFFLALDCYINPDRKHFPDASEQIDVRLVPVDELEGMVASGKINHALAALSIMLCMRKYKEIKGTK